MVDSLLRKIARKVEVESTRVVSRSGETIGVGDRRGRCCPALGRRGFDPACGGLDDVELASPQTIERASRAHRPPMLRALMRFDSPHRRTRVRPLSIASALAYSPRGWP